MADCPFKRQCEQEAIYYQNRAAHYAFLARNAPALSRHVVYWQGQAAAYARKAMQNLFAVI